MEVIRLVEKKDLPELKIILDSCRLFPSNLLDELTTDYFNNPKSEDYWFTTELDGQLVSIGCTRLEKHTLGTYKLMGIGVHKDFEGRGIAKNVMFFMEEYLKKKNARIFLVETVKDDSFDVINDLYHRLGLRIEATVKDYFSEGIDKIIYVKRLDQ